jgi:hypothetical protein
LPVGPNTDVAEGRGVVDDVELEVVDDAVELEGHHPVDELADRHSCSGRRDRVQREESATGVTDDAARVVCPSDDLERAPHGTLGHPMSLDRVGRRKCGFEEVDRLMHVAPVSVRHRPAVEIGPRADQRQHGVSEGGHATNPSRSTHDTPTSALSQTTTCNSLDSNICSSMMKA